jgi:hypothetical protein
VGGLCTREKYLRIKRNVYELSWGISAFLLREFKSLKKGLVDLSLSTRVMKEADRGEKEFRALGKKSGRKLEISPGSDSFIISLIFNFKMF